MKIGIIDADLVGLKQHRFPNLACMKISGYYKKLGHVVKLLLNYENLNEYDKIFIAKVFTETVVPNHVLELENVTYGGTGFFYDKAEPLPYEIEHSFPDYHLYDEWVNERLENGAKPLELDYYMNHSIGFTTRGCIRQCSFCVNKNYTRVNCHSPISEFYDPTRKYITLLDDNILAYKGWKDIINELNATGKRFQYRQGMDVRLLTDEKCEALAKSSYKGDYMFSFDNIKDYEIVDRKLKLWRKYVTKTTKLCMLVAYDETGKYDDEFWRKDIINAFERIRIMMKNGCNPYIMRFEEYKNSPYKGIYINLARWCNQPSMYKKKSFREYAEMPCHIYKSACYKYMKEFESIHPDIAQEYYDMKYIDLINQE